MHTAKLENVLIAIRQTPHRRNRRVLETAIFKRCGIKAKNWDELEEELKENAREILMENSELLIHP